MPHPFYECDDIYDAAADAVRAINARLSRRGLQLSPDDASTLRDALVSALQSTEVEEGDFAELEAFQVLELLSQAFPGEAWALADGEPYSPSKAKNGDYTRRLKQGRSTHPPEPGSDPKGKQPAITAAQKVEALEQLAGKLQADKIDFAKRLPILRHKAAELVLPIRDHELIGILAAARRRRLDSDGLLRTGDRLDLTPEPWICEGLLFKVA